jgi:hypothetical protein
MVTMTTRGDAPIAGSERTIAKARSTNASRLFGYDIFISFALDPPPRGTLCQRLTRNLSHKEWREYVLLDLPMPLNVRACRYRRTRSESSGPGAGCPGAS